MKEREVHRKRQKEEGTKVEGRRQERTGQRRRARALRLPPPDSTVWPEEYRGERWKRAYGVLFAGKCQVCAYSCPLSKWRQSMDRCMGMPRLLLCTNSLDSPGELVEMLPIETCRNFMQKHWRSARRHEESPALRPSIRPTPPSGGSPWARTCSPPSMPRDYKRLNKHKWYAYRHGRKIYAMPATRGKMVLHAPHDYAAPPGPCRGPYRRQRPEQPALQSAGLHGGAESGQPKTSRRGLRVCRRVPRRQQMGGGHRLPRASIYYLGLFDDPVAAAKARDRKAYELHGDTPTSTSPRTSARYRKMFSRKAAKPRRKARL